MSDCLFLYFSRGDVTCIVADRTVKLNRKLCISSKENTVVDVVPNRLEGTYLGFCNFI